MRTETAGTLARIATTLIEALQDNHVRLPEALAEKVAENPVIACESLNELAVSRSALDETTDSALASLYESLEAFDARSHVDDATKALIQASVQAAIRPEPEPEPEPEASAEAEEPAEASDSQETEEKAAAPAREDRRGEARPGRGMRRHERPETPRDNEGQARGETSEEERPKDASDRPPVDALAPQAEEERPAAKPAEGAAPAEDAAPAEESPATTEGSAPEASVTDQGPLVPGRFLTVDQTIAVLGVSRPLIYNLIKDGTFPAHKKGRSWQIDAAAVDDYNKHRRRRR